MTIEEIKNKIGILNQEVSNPDTSQDRRIVCEKEVQNLLVMLDEEVKLEFMPITQLREKIAGIEADNIEQINSLRVKLLKKLDKDIQQLNWEILQPYGNKQEAYKRISELRLEIRSIRDSINENKV